MDRDPTFLQQFSAAAEVARHEYEADLFEQVLQIARARRDRRLTKLALAYRDEAQARATSLLTHEVDAPRIRAFMLELARTRA